MTGGDETGLTSDGVQADPHVASAADPDHVLDLVEALFGNAVQVFAVDHAVDRLVLVRESESESIDLNGELRRAILRAEPITLDDVTWIPIPERDQTVFVARIPGNVEVDPSVISANEALGAVMNGHRKRFESLETKRRRKDMSIAAELQWDLLPVRGDFFDGIQVAGILEPAYEVAGDAFDYAWWDGALWAYSFDGMGHGIDATLTSVLVLAAVRNARRRGLGLIEQMNEAGHAVHDQWGGDRFVTGVACRVCDGATEFVNAGHEPSRSVIGGRVVGMSLEAELPLGVRSDHGYTLQTGPTLNDGDGIALFSDGPGNASGRDGQGNLGADGLERILARSWSDRPFEAAHDTMAGVLDHIGDNDVQDDLTAVVIRLDSTIGRT